MKAPQKDSLNRWIDPESREQRDLARHPFLEDDASLRIVRMGVLCTAVVVLVFFAWSAVARVDETTVAVGEVIPSAKLQSVQHLEGGIITDLLVEEGSLVEPGQVIARLDPTSASALLGHSPPSKKSRATSPSWSAINRSPSPRAWRRRTASGPFSNCKCNSGDPSFTA